MSTETAGQLTLADVLHVDAMTRHMQLSQFNDSKAWNNGSGCRYLKHAERDGKAPSLSAYYQRSKGL